MAETNDVPTTDAASVRHIFLAQREEMTVEELILRNPPAGYQVVDTTVSVNPETREVTFWHRIVRLH